MEENHIKTVLRHKTTSPKFHSRLNTPFSNFALSHLRYPQFSFSYEWWRIVFSSLCKLFYRIIKIIIIIRTSWECIFHVWVDNAPYIYTLVWLMCKSKRVSCIATLVASNIIEGNIYPKCIMPSGYSGEICEGAAL